MDPEFIFFPPEHLPVHTPNRARFNDKSICWTMRKCSMGSETGCVGFFFQIVLRFDQFFCFVQFRKNYQQWIH